MIIIQNKDRIESLLRAPNSLSASNKRWHSAFVSIYCSRALISFFKDSVPDKKNSEVPPSPSFFKDSVPDKKNAMASPSPSFVMLDLQEEIRFKVDQATLTKLVKEKELECLQNIGGVDGLASALETNVECGIHGDVDDIARRHESFGSNTYIRPPTKGLFHFVVEAFKDLTILILLGCAVLSLVFGIKETGIKEGWYEGGSIFVAVFLVIAVSAISNFKQNRQFDKLSKVSNNIQIDVLRAGRRQQISIFEIVVGDVICLKIGDQVPADGLFLDGHSLQVDESSMTM